MSRTEERRRVRAKRVRDAVGHAGDVARAARREAERARLADAIREATARGDFDAADRAWRALAQLGGSP